MSKQTALQHFIDKITSNHDKHFKDFYKAEIEEAIQMEREQITDAYVECWMYDDGNPFRKVKENAQQYYEQTYGGNNEK